jgi:hypothetical protein
MRALEQIGFFAGLGVVIAGVSAMAIGRLSVISVRDARRAGRAASPEPAEPEAQPSPAGGTRFALPLRRKAAAARTGGTEVPSA